MKKAEREKQARQAKLRVLSLTLFELGGKLTQTERHARSAGLSKVGDWCAERRKTIESWKERIKAKTVAIPGGPGCVNTYGLSYRDWLAAARVGVKKLKRSQAELRQAWWQGMDPADYALGDA